MLEIDGKSAHAHYNLGSVYYALKDQVKAESHWRKAIACEKSKVRVKEEESLTEEELKYSLIVRKRQVSFLSNKSLGKLYLEQGQFKKAIEELDRAIRLKKSDPEPYFFLAKVFEKKKEYRRAYIRISFLCLRQISHNSPQFPPTDILE